MSHQTVEVECQRCLRRYSYPVLPEDLVIDLMRRVALLHRQSSQECGRRFGATGLIIHHLTFTSPLFTNLERAS